MRAALLPMIRSFVPCIHVGSTRNRSPSATVALNPPCQSDGAPRRRRSDDPLLDTHRPCAYGSDGQWLSSATRDSLTLPPWIRRCSLAADGACRPCRTARQLERQRSLVSAGGATSGQVYLAIRTSDASVPQLGLGGQVMSSPGDGTRNASAATPWAAQRLVGVRWHGCCDT